MRQFDTNGQWLLDVKELFIALGGSKWNNLNIYIFISIYDSKFKIYLLFFKNLKIKLKKKRNIKIFF